MSHDFGATFQSLDGNLKGEAIKTLTEDQRNPDVIYAGAETGLFVSLDRGKSWPRLRSNFPDVRVDEITLHPRDNAMLARDARPRRSGSSITCRRSRSTRPRRRADARRCSRSTRR